MFAFFVVSGYSIGASIEREPVGYFSRRVRRIYPLYLTSIAIALAATWIIGWNHHWPVGLATPDLTWPMFLGSLVMLQTFAVLAVPLAGQTWSLAIEWWLYMLAPFLQRLPSAAVFAALAVSATAFMVLQRSIGDLSHAPPGAAFACLAWFWLVGFLAYRWRRSSLGPTLVVGAPFLVLACGNWLGWACMLSLPLIAACDQIPVPTRARGLLNWLGEVSFPIYVMHAAVLAVMGFWGFDNSLLVVVVVMMLSAACLHFVEFPVRRLLRAYRFRD